MEPRGKVYIGGEVVEPNEAKVSVFDRGFLYGDSVYETLRVYGGEPFAMEAHLERLYASGELVGFHLPWAADEIRSPTLQTLGAAGIPDAYLRIIASRGAGVFGLDPALADVPQLIVMVMPLPSLPATIYSRGLSACLVTVQRNLKGALDPRAKTGNYMNSVLALREARNKGADEALMLDHRGRVAEGSSANVFTLVEGTWCTPPLEVGILSGITRRKVLELCRRHGIAATERILWPDDLMKAQQIFFCSSIREVVPITRLDNRPVGDGTVGKATTDLLKRYRAEVAAQTTS